MLFIVAPLDDTVDSPAGNLRDESAYLFGLVYASAKIISGTQKKTQKKRQTKPNERQINAKKTPNDAK